MKPPKKDLTGMGKATSDDREDLNEETTGFIG